MRKGAEGSQGREDREGQEGELEIHQGSGRNHIPSRGTRGSLEEKTFFNFFELEDLNPVLLNLTFITLKSTVIENILSYEILKFSSDFRTFGWSFLVKKN